VKVLVVDDEAKFGLLVGDALRDAGHEVAVLSSGTAAVAELAAHAWDVVVTDLKMAPVDGLAVLSAAKETSPDTDVVLMTAHGTVETAVAAMHQGAYDFVTKPFSLDELVLLLERVAERRSLRSENAALKQQLSSDERFSTMVGESAPLERVRELVAKVAPSDATVLVLGESGVGKELVARLIHRQGPRAGRPFSVMHAAALPENLLESELFGYEKGAFTGAAGRKPGRLELADGGTLFLDEIGEIPAAFQVKLLRFLQEKTFVRLGGTRTIKVECRIIAATNRDLAQAVRERSFREDLYYRLSVFPISVPPLRERRVDIAPLARHILVRLGYSRELDETVIPLLAAHEWPGNVRELENVLERALILAAGDAVGPRHIQLPEPVLARSAADDPIPGSLPGMERQMLEDALEKAGGNKARAARALGITRRMLYTKLRKFGLAVNDEP
jgi:DNA-binding NtrC family response regulator